MSTLPPRPSGYQPAPPLVEAEARLRALNTNDPDHAARVLVHEFPSVQYDAAVSLLRMAVPHLGETRAMGAVTHALRAQQAAERAAAEQQPAADEQPAPEPVAAEQQPVTEQPATITFAADGDGWEPPARTTARTLIARGFAVTPVDAETGSHKTGWAVASAAPEDFSGHGLSIVCGPVSHGNEPGYSLAGIDLDSPGAVGEADEFLPDTGMVEGRPGKPKSHRYWLVPNDTIPPEDYATCPTATVVRERFGHPGPRNLSFKIHGKEAFKLCGTGAKLAAPPSVNQKSNEWRAWEGGSPGEPAVVPWPDLLAAAERLAAAIDATAPTRHAAADHTAADIDPPPRGTLEAEARRCRAANRLHELSIDEPSVSGCGGHDAMMKAAREAAWGYGLDADTAVYLMVTVYNRTADPPWSVPEIEHKVREAMKPDGFGLPFGYRLPPAVVPEDISDHVGGPNDPVPLGIDVDRGGGNDDGPDATPPPGYGAGATNPPPGRRFRRITSEELDATDYRPDWVVELALVAAQPGVIAGPSKALKTSLAVDLAVSIATGTPFLGRPEFKVPRPRRVAVFSGESGTATLKETAARVRKAKGVTVADEGGRLAWYEDLPKIADPRSVAAIREELRDFGADVAIIDPFYLAVGGKVDHANLFEMGDLIMPFVAGLVADGVTPLIIHHANRQLMTGVSMTLSNLAYSGLEQHVRQWVLLNRREPYDPSSGTHKLEVTIGGSVGHSSAWAVDVTEGHLRPDFTGRTWELSTSPLEAAKKVEADEKEKTKQAAAAEKAEADYAAVRTAVFEIAAPDKRGASEREVRDRTGFRREKVARVLAEMVTAKRLYAATGRRGNKDVTLYWPGDPAGWLPPDTPDTTPDDATGEGA